MFSPKAVESKNPLTELRTALDRIDALIEHARVAYKAEGGLGGGVGSSTEAAKSRNGGGGRIKKKIRGAGVGRKGSIRGAFGRSKAGGKDRKSRGGHVRNESSASALTDASASTGRGTDDASSVASPVPDDLSSTILSSTAESVDSASIDSASVDSASVGGGSATKKQHSPTSSTPSSGWRMGNNPWSAAPVRTARFMPFHQADEEEMVELLRRSAELVVHGERGASAALTKLNEHSSSGGDDEGKDDLEREYEEHQAVFEHFCEREGLQTIVNVLTGLAFRPIADPPPDGETPKGRSDGGGLSPDEGDAADDATDASDATERTDNFHRGGGGDGGPDGDTFASVDNEGGGEGDGVEEEDHITLLPPMSIATQAVQSVSILLQNVVRVTSLYFLLSNNRANDLINLPLDLYSLAEVEARRADPSKPADLGSLRANREQTPEMAELTTHFVSFLKSLAMRMNEETLQFFLAYPTEGGAGKGGGSPVPADSETASGRHFSSSNEAPSESGAPPEESANGGGGGGGLTVDRAFGDGDGDIGPALQTPTASPVGGDAAASAWREAAAAAEREVQFPLYARALKFCSQDQESFVRVTAMNICLNTIRLATLRDNGEGDSSGHDDGGGPDDGGRDKPLSFKSPDGGSLHNAAALPFRERVAIARHVCNPSRVEALVSPIFVKLAQLCGALEETIRGLDELDARLLSCGEELRAEDKDEDEDEDKDKGEKKGNDDEEEKEEKASDSTPENDDSGGDVELEDGQVNRKRAASDVADEVKKILSRRRYLADSLMEVSADLQDELLLLEDVLKVGLTSVNEQTIEMMLATFIYPLLLQPLRLFMQRHRPSQSSAKGGAVDSSSGGASAEKMGFCDAQDASHPFSTDSIANSLLRSGLLDGGADSSEESLAVDYATRGLADMSMGLPDSSFVKTALFGIAAVFHSITNKPLLHLLLSALFHPLAPDVEGGHMIRVKPEVVSTDARGIMRIRADSSDCISYNFGQSSKMSGDGNSGDETSSSAKLSDRCVFVLAPALSDVFEGNTKSQSLDGADFKTRMNPHRRVILSCLGGTDGMSALQSLAVFAMDAAISSVEDRFISDIILGCDEKPFSHSKEEGLEANSTSLQSSCSAANPNYLIEVISSLCVSIMTASLSSDGIWKLRFNSVAANALLKSATSGGMTKAAAMKLIDHRLRQSASFLGQLPSRIDASRPSMSDLRGGQKDVVEDNKEQTLNIIMDRIFFGPLLHDDKSIVEHLARRRADPPGDKFWDGPSCVPIALMSSLDDVSVYICTEPESAEIAHQRNDAPLRCGAKSAFAHLQLDAFARYFNGVIPDNRQMLNGAYGKLPVVGNGEAQISDDLSPDEDDDIISYDGCPGPNRTIFASLKQRLTSVIFDRDINDTGSTLHSRNESRRPIPGAVVGLVGRTAFPCVCEVSPENAQFFVGGGACVVAEGVKWQSLYLIPMGKYIVLAEPEKGGSGGNGRIVSSCRLACLVVDKDDPPAVDNASPARRLLLSYMSPYPKPPEVFIMDDSTLASGAARNSVKMFRSRMDLWFEDKTAAAHAMKILSMKISKARSRRGNKINEALTHDEE